MKPKLIAIYLLIVTVPVVLAAGLGLRFAANEQESVQIRFDKLLEAKLVDVSETVSAMIEASEVEIRSLLESSGRDRESLRETARVHRLVKQVFVMDSEGAITYPTESEGVTDREQNFLSRTETIWESGTRFVVPPESSSVRGWKRSYRAEIQSGWHTWFWGSGLHFLYWQVGDNGETIGAEVDRAALMAEVIAALPDSTGLTDGYAVLKDAQDAVIYVWGAGVPQDGEYGDPRVVVPLNEPFGSWHFAYYMSADAVGASVLPMALGVMAIFICMVGLAVYFYRENSRDMREAGQRVSFVNQVSHELKTPLTNIRMYAELLQKSLPDSEEKQIRQVGVVVSESQRLSRLINNVLSFGRRQKGKLKLRKAEALVDETIESVVANFAPTLEQRGINVQFAGNAEESCMVDTDILEQIVGNLLSNAEKYAGKGASVLIESSQSAATVKVIVSDDGPGIPPLKAEAIFEPFVRLSNKLTDGTAGAGIGLSIARDLARLHGGDLKLLLAKQGAKFELTLEIS